MGQAIDFPERNVMIGKPKDMTENQCYTLPAARIITHIPGLTDKDHSVQVPATVSCWELSPDELNEVMKTGKVYVKTLGEIVIPLSVHGKLPIYTTGSNIDDIVLPKQN